VKEKRKFRIAITSNLLHHKTRNFSHTFTNVYEKNHHLGSAIAFDGRHIANICVPCFIGHYLDSCFDYVVVAHYEYMLFLHVFISVIMAECFNWTQEDLVKAVDDIKVNKLSYQNAAKNMEFLKAHFVIMCFGRYKLDVKIVGISKRGRGSEAQTTKRTW